MTVISFETHSTSLDNEAGLASGHHDTDLSQLGCAQAVELGSRYAVAGIYAVFCSDLQRACRTAEIAFSGRGIAIARDARLRECDYGELTHRPTAEIDAVRSEHVRQPFPGGESYAAATLRTGSLLDEIARRYPCGRVVLIGHRATFYALEHLVRGVPLEQAVAAPFAWQPGRQYTLH